MGGKMQLVFYVCEPGVDTWVLTTPLTVSRRLVEAEVDETVEGMSRKLRGGSPYLAGVLLEPRPAYQLPVRIPYAIRLIRMVRLVAETELEVSTRIEEWHGSEARVRGNTRRERLLPEFLPQRILLLSTMRPRVLWRRGRGRSCREAMVSLVLRRIRRDTRRCNTFKGMRMMICRRASSLPCLTERAGDCYSC